MHHRTAHVPASNGDETFGLEDAKCFTQRGAAHFELLEKFVLLWEQLPVSDFAIHDSTPQARRDKVRDPGLAELGSSTRAPLHTVRIPSSFGFRGIHMH